MRRRIEMNMSCSRKSRMVCENSNARPPKTSFKTYLRLNTALIIVSCLKNSERIFSRETVAETSTHETEETPSTTTIIVIVDLS